MYDRASASCYLAGMKHQAVRLLAAVVIAIALAACEPMAEPQVAATVLPAETIAGLSVATAPTGSTWRGLAIAVESRCSDYEASDYSYPQSVEPQVAANLGGYRIPEHWPFIVAHGEHCRVLLSLRSPESRRQPLASVACCRIRLHSQGTTYPTMRAVHATSGRVRLPVRIDALGSHHGATRRLRGSLAGRSGRASACSSVLAPLPPILRSRLIRGRVRRVRRGALYGILLTMDEVPFIDVGPVVAAILAGKPYDEVDLVAYDLILQQQDKVPVSVRGPLMAAMVITAKDLVADWPLVPNQRLAGAGIQDAPGGRLRVTHEHGRAAGRGSCALIVAG